MQSLGRLAVRVITLAPEDSVGKAAEAVRASGVGAVPVLEGGRLLGLVTAEGLAAFLREQPVTGASRAAVAAVPLERALVLPEAMAPREALFLLDANGVARAPVLDGAGRLLGMVGKAELVSAVCGRVRPPIVGGMATPFGVYLTGGGARGGVGDLALVSTGLFLFGVLVLAYWLAVWLLSPGGPAYSHPMLARWLAALPAGDTFYAGWLLLFALLFRLSWVSGYHAAEHQVVHALEAGDDLLPETVRRKPRVHPRCGTNLVAAFSLMSLFWQARFSFLSDPTIPILVTLLLWRRVGAWLQQYVTTRPASDRQIRSGIAAAQQLMERYQKRPTSGCGLPQRIWQMGLVQVLAGWMLGLGLLQLAQWLLPGLWPRVPWIF